MAADRKRSAVPQDLDQIGLPAFAYVRRGYDPDQVVAHLATAATELDALKTYASQLEDVDEQLRAALDEADGEIAALHSHLDDGLHDLLAGHLDAVLAPARVLASELRARAEDDALLIVDGARSRAEALLREAERRFKDRARQADDVFAERGRAADALVRRAEADADDIREGARHDAEEIRAEAQVRAEALVQAGRVQASVIVSQAEDTFEQVRADAAELLDQARLAGDDVLDEARAEAEDIVAEAQVHAEEILEETHGTCDRLLSDLTVRRRRLKEQVEQLQAGRERLMVAYTVVQQTMDDATTELHDVLPEARDAARAAIGRAYEVEADEVAVAEQIAAARTAHLPQEIDLRADADAAQRERSDRAAADRFAKAARRARSYDVEVYEIEADGGGDRAGMYGSEVYEADSYEADAGDGYADDGYATDGYATDGYGADDYEAGGYEAADYRSDVYRTDEHPVSDYRANGYGTDGHRSAPAPSRYIAEDTDRFPAERPGRRSQRAGTDERGPRSADAVYVIEDDASGSGPIETVGVRAGGGPDDLAPPRRSDGRTGDPVSSEAVSDHAGSQAAYRSPQAGSGRATGRNAGRSGRRPVRAESDTVMPEVPVPDPDDTVPMVRPVARRAPDPIEYQGRWSSAVRVLPPGPKGVRPTPSSPLDPVPTPAAPAPAAPAAVASPVPASAVPTGPVPAAAAGSDQADPTIAGAGSQAVAAATGPDGAHGEAPGSATGAPVHAGPGVVDAPPVAAPVNGSNGAPADADAVAAPPPDLRPPPPAMPSLPLVAIAGSTDPTTTVPTTADPTTADLSTTEASTTDPTGSGIATAGTPAEGVSSDNRDIAPTSIDMTTAPTLPGGGAAEFRDPIVGTGANGAGTASPSESAPPFEAAALAESALAPEHGVPATAAPGDLTHASESDPVGATPVPVPGADRPADLQPAAESQPATESQPAAESQPVTESQSLADVQPAAGHRSPFAHSPLQGTTGADVATGTREVDGSRQPWWKGSAPVGPLSEVDLVAALVNGDSGGSAVPVTPAPPADAVADARGRCDTVVTAAQRALRRRLKGTLADDQNLILDALRQVTRGVPAASAILPDDTAHRDRYVAAALEGLSTGAGAGRALALELATDETRRRLPGAVADDDVASDGLNSTVVDDVAAWLATEIVETLRSRLLVCFPAEAMVSDDARIDKARREEVQNALRSVYRRVKGAKLDALIDRAGVEVVYRSVRDHLPPGVRPAGVEPLDLFRAVAPAASV